MPYRWKQFLKSLDIGDEEYNKCYQLNTLLKKDDGFLQIHKYINKKL